MFRLHSFPLEVESSCMGNIGPVFTWYQNKICSIRFCISLQIKHINCRLKQPTLIMVSLTPIKEWQRQFQHPWMPTKVPLCPLMSLRGAAGAFWRSPHLHWGPVGGCTVQWSSSESICLRESYVHLPASKHMNKRLRYGPVNQFT